jgi:outer membrane protein OmpA-like peptidoglycan-associated protein
MTREESEIMQMRLISAMTAATLAMGGCASMDQTQQDTAKGAGIGAAAGAVIGAAVNRDNRGKGAMVGAAVGAAAGAIGGNIWSKRMQEQKQKMEQAAQGTGVGVSQTADNQLKLNIPSDISFDVGKSDIKPQMRPVLDKFAQTLVENPATTVRIIGHTDSTGSDAINDPLSVDRASSARNYLTARGVGAERIAVDGRGSREPIADNRTAQGRAQNRRIEIFVAEPEPAPPAAPAR